MSSMDCYDILGCSKDSTSRDIKRAYHALALKYHPDKNISEFDREKFQQILEAWHVLGDPESRCEYDALQKQEELDSESIPIHARVSVDELQAMVGDDTTLRYQCRCGGFYCIEKDSVKEQCQTVYVPCSECTFFIAVET